ncbi:MAG: hypothetical protein ACJ8C4_15120 [Gemmataceae bacterium]
MGRTARLSNQEMSELFSEINLLGTLGHSLWHLRQHLPSRALRFELKELSQLGSGINPAGDALRLRGQGFLLLAAAQLAKQGFEIEFVERAKGRVIADLLVHRDGVTFCCEATSRQPNLENGHPVEFFWSVISSVAEDKKRQVAFDGHRYGVLIIDCTPIWDAFSLGQIPVGGDLVYMVPPELGGPRSGAVSLVRFDDSEFSRGLRGLERILRGSNVQSIILWKHHCEIFEDGYRRHIFYRVIGSIEGAPFWSYFDRPMVFPGPNVHVQW